MQVAGKPEEYYVLKPINTENSTVYVPTNNETLISRMKRLLSQDETLAMIRSIPDEETIWIEDGARRRFVYGTILEGGDRREILKLIKTLFLHEQEMRNGRKKMNAADERLLKEAEKRLYGEFAHVLKIEPGQVLPLISNLIGETAGTQPGCSKELHSKER